MGEYTCPRCGSTAQFSVDITTTIKIDGAGGLRELPKLVDEIDGNSMIECQACGNIGLVHEFQN